MDATYTALHGQNTTVGGRLYMASELGEKNWKLSLGGGQRAPSRFTVAAGDTTAVLTAIAAPTHTSTAVMRPAANLMVDSASIEVNRRARRAKTDRLDSDKLLFDGRGRHDKDAISTTGSCHVGEGTLFKFGAAAGFKTETGCQ
jgi:transposase